jgi:predicted ribosomally synthesized peptide with nif11-like leader
MSMAEASRLLLLAKSDPEFLYTLAAIEDPAERVVFIVSEGFDCTLEELAAASPLPDQPVERRTMRHPLPWHSGQRRLASV